VVTDTTVLQSYAVLRSWAVPVAELLTAVLDNKGLIGVPALCLVDACATLSSAERCNLDELLDAAAPIALVLPVSPGDARTIMHRPHGQAAGTAHALGLARLHAAMLATYDPKLYDGLLPADDILDLSA
jgi:hypothetical protein